MEKQLALPMDEKEAFINDILSLRPRKTDVLINKFANNSEYLPISIIEMKLDKIFKGCWQLDNFKHQVIGNEIVGTIELSVFWPPFNTWIKRVGAAAVPIQMASGSNTTEIAQKKLPKALVKDFPHLKSECIKNAAKSLGPVFGRDLNRKETDTYIPIHAMMAEKKKQKSSLDREFNDEK